MIRGLVKEVDDPANLCRLFEVTMEYLRHLGLKNVTELPDYEKLHKHEYITNAVKYEIQ